MRGQAGRPPGQGKGAKGRGRHLSRNGNEGLLGDAADEEEVEVQTLSERIANLVSSSKAKLRS